MTDYNDEQPGSQGEQGAEKAAKGVKAAWNSPIGRKARGFVANMGKTAGKKIVAAIVSAISLKVLLIIIAAAAIISIFVFFAIEAEKSKAAEAWADFVDSIAKTDQNFAAKGYKSMGGVTKEKFKEILERIDSGQLPIDENLSPEEKEKLEFENKQRQIEFKEVSTEQEKVRIKKYLQADRDSTLRAFKDKSFFENFFNLFNDAGLGEAKDPPRLKSSIKGNNEDDLNHKADFVELEKVLMSYTEPESSDPDDIEEHEEKVKAIVAKVRDQYKKIHEKLKNVDDPLLEDYMKQYVEIKLQARAGGDHSSDLTADDIDIVELKDQDEIFRQLDTYALSWKVLYMIDKALDEAEFEDFAKIDNYSEENKTEAIDLLKSAFIAQAIPRFMPEFKMERHISIKVTSIHESSWPDDDCEGDCDTDHHYSLTIEVLPVYKLTVVDAWNKYLEMPTAEKKVEETEYERYDDDDGSGHESTTRTFTYMPVDAPSAQPEPINEPMEKVSKPSGDGIRTTGHAYYESVTLNNPDMVKTTRTKVDDVKKVFIQIYNEESYKKIKFDVEHMLYVTTGIQSMARARCDVAVAFDLTESLNLNARILKGIKNLFGGTSGNVNVNGVDLIMRDIVKLDEVRQRFPGVNEAIVELSQKYSADVNLIRAIVNQESGFNPHPPGNSSEGLMQISDDVARMYGVEPGNKTDIKQNLTAGIQYILKLINESNGDVRVAIVKYNLGPGATDALGSTWEEIYPKIPLRPDIPSNPEVHRKYSREVLGAYVQYKTLYPAETGSASDTIETGGAIEKLHWNEAKEILPSSGDTTMTVIDVETNMAFNILRYGGANHADVVPATEEDHNILCKIIGDTEHKHNGNCFTYRPTILVVDGRKLACARHSTPHGSSILGHKTGFVVHEPNCYPEDTEGEEGHFCIHFVGSTTHGGGNVRADAQAAIEVAANSNINFAVYPSGLDTSDYCYGAEGGGNCVGPGCVGTNQNSAQPIIIDGSAFPIQVSDPQAISDEMIGHDRWFGLREHPTEHSCIKHEGVDLAASEGTPVLAFAPGKVIRKSKDNVNGNYVIIEHEALGLKTSYCHMADNSVIVSEGQTVEAGQKIGGVGSTGRSTGPHLHFGVTKGGTKVDPAAYLKKFGTFDGHNVTCQN